MEIFINFSKITKKVQNLHFWRKNVEKIWSKVAFSIWVGIWRVWATSFHAWWDGRHFTISRRLRLAVTFSHFLNNSRFSLLKKKVPVDYAKIFPFSKLGKCGLVALFPSLIVTNFFSEMIFFTKNTDFQVFFWKIEF